MNEKKLTRNLTAIISKYKNLPLDCEAVSDSFINEMAEVLSNSAEDSEDFIHIMNFFKDFDIGM